MNNVPCHIDSTRGFGKWCPIVVLVEGGKKTKVGEIVKLSTNP